MKIENSTLEGIVSVCDSAQTGARIVIIIFVFNRISCTIQRTADIWAPDWRIWSRPRKNNHWVILPDLLLILVPIPVPIPVPIRQTKEITMTPLRMKVNRLNVTKIWNMQWSAMKIDSISKLNWKIVENIGKSCWKFPKLIYWRVFHTSSPIRNWYIHNTHTSNSILYHTYKIIASSFLHCCFIFSVSQILFEYSDTFKNVDADVYIKIWPKYAQQLEQLMQKEYTASNFHTQWSEEIHNLFILLKLFPPKFGRKPAENRETFINSIEKLIVFKPVNVHTLLVFVSRKYTDVNMYLLAWYSSDCYDGSRKQAPVHYRLRFFKEHLMLASILNCNNYILYKRSSKKII